MLEEIMESAYKIGLVVNVVAMIVCPIVAHKKGRNTVGWFFGGLFLSLIGIIIVCCLDSKNTTTYKDNNKTTNNGYSATNKEFYDTLFSKKEESKKEAPKINQWKCPNCGTINSDDNDYCSKCLDKRNN